MIHVHALAHERKLGELTEDQLRLALKLAYHKGDTPIVSRERIRDTYRRLTSLTVQARKPGLVKVTPVALSEDDYPRLFPAGCRSIQYALSALIDAGLVGEDWHRIPDPDGIKRLRRVVWVNI